jgi:hexokinase
MTNNISEWTSETRNEFYINSLDNYNLFDNIEDSVKMFIKEKTEEKNGRRIKPIPISFVREIRNN